MNGPQGWYLIWQSLVDGCSDCARNFGFDKSKLKNTLREIWNKWLTCFRVMSFIYWFGVLQKAASVLGCVANDNFYCFFLQVCMYIMVLSWCMLLKLMQHFIFSSKSHAWDCAFRFVHLFIQTSPLPVLIKIDVTSTTPYITLLWKCEQCYMHVLDQKSSFTV